MIESWREHLRKHGVVKGLFIRRRVFFLNPNTDFSVPPTCQNTAVGSMGADDELQDRFGTVYVYDNGVNPESGRRVSIEDPEHPNHQEWEDLLFSHR